MGILYIDRADCTLELSGAVLTLRAPEQATRSIPAALLERVVLRANTHLSSNTLGGLAELGVAVHVLGGRRGERAASLLGANGKDVQRRIGQVRRLEDAAFRTQWCRRLVGAKIGTQQRLLGRALHQRPDLRKPLLDAQASLHTCRQRLSGATDPDSLRGLEGAAAAAYFGALSQLFPPSLGFTARRRRPAPDPVNACLSLGYTLLHGIAVEAAHAHGLDPMIGYLHAPCHGRASLACDLMEPWRAQVDALVWRLCSQRILEASHFGRDGSGACLLGKAGRSLFYAAWAPRARVLLRTLRRHAQLAARALDAAPPAQAEAAP